MASKRFSRGGSLSNKRLRKIKKWLIIGCILTPLFSAASILPASNYSYFSLLALFEYFITIPFCCCAISCAKNAKKRDDMVKWGVVSLIFVSWIGGLIMLTTSDDAFMDSYETNQIKTESKERNKEQSKVEKKYKNLQWYISYFGRADALGGLYTKEELFEEIINISSSLAKIEYKDSKEIHERFSLEYESYKKEQKEESYKALQENINKYREAQKYRALKKIITISKELSEEDFKDSKSIYDNFLPIYEVESKKANKKTQIVAIIIACLLISIGPTAAIINSINYQKEEERYDALYNELYPLVYTDDYRDIVYYSTLEKIDDVPSNHYSSKWSSLQAKLVSNHNYELLAAAISSYDGTKETNSKITSYLGYVESGYKKIEYIKKDFENVKKYTANISQATSSSASSSATSSTALENRQMVANLYKYSNTSNLWKFDKYVGNLSIPYLICGAEFSCDSYYFKWTQNSSGNLSWHLQTPSGYSSSTSYYFGTTFTGSGYDPYTKEARANKMTFYLYPKNGSSSSKINLFAVSGLTYSKKEDAFKCVVYSFATYKTTVFTGTD